MAAPVLKAQHLGIQFGGLKAVDDFNMEIGESELVGLIGPNGAGKTTVFNLITGVYKPTEGSFYLCGERMNGKKTHQIVHAGIARTFQNIRLFKKMTVIENVKTAMQGHTTYGMADAIFRTKKYWQQEAEITARAKELLSVVHLSGKEDLEADNLPYGEQRRLEIARALATDPKLIALDEPAAGMNATEKVVLRELIDRIRNDNRTILIIEHDVKLVMGLCDRVAVLDYGALVIEDVPAVVQNDQRVIEAYLGA
jgi:branched-chain amino acid transport system ATP-binding protein